VIGAAVMAPARTQHTLAEVEATSFTEPSCRTRGTTWSTGCPLATEVTEFARAAVTRIGSRHEVINAAERVFDRFCSDRVAGFDFRIAFAVIESLDSTSVSGASATNGCMKSSTTLYNWLPRAHIRRMDRKLHADRFRVEIKHRCPPPNRYTWEIYCNDKVLPVKESRAQFGGWEEASQAAKQALKKFSQY
jgi:hypothetical protein